MIGIGKRDKAVQRVLNGEPISKVAKSLNVSRGSIYSWLKAYEIGGLTGLIHKRSRPHNSSSKLDDLATDIICQTALDHPSENIRALKEILFLEGFKYSISTIHKYLKIANIVSMENRVNRLLLYQEHEGVSSLSKKSLEALEKHCSHFADREKFEKLPGTKFLVTLRVFRVDKDYRNEIPVWFFVDLHRMMVTAIVDDQMTFDKKLDSQHEQLIPENSRHSSWGYEVMTPLTVWWNVYGEVLDRSSVKLLFPQSTLDEENKLKIAESQILSEIDLHIVKSFSELPAAFLHDFQSRIGKIYVNTLREVKDISDRKRRFNILTNELKDGLLEYNSTPIKKIFPMSQQKPKDRSPFSSLMIANPITKISEYLKHEYDGSDIFYVPGENWNSAYKNMAIASHNFDPSIFGNLDADVRRTLLPPRSLNDKPKIQRKNTFQMAYQELHIREYTNLKGSSDLNRLSNKIPFILVYLLVIGEIPKGRYYTCPNCNKNSMYYYAEPKAGHKYANVGQCFKNRGGCDKTTNSINLLYYKLNYSPQQAFKWLLANFDSWMWGVDTDFQLSEQDMDRYRCVDIPEPSGEEVQKDSENVPKRYGRQGISRL